MHPARPAHRPTAPQPGTTTPMARRVPEPLSDDTGPSNDWIVTFSDCMTLLLCFFVMLLSFSSFDPEDLTYVLDGFQTSNESSLFPNTRLPREAYLPNDRVYVDRTTVGSEMPTEGRLRPNVTPRAPYNLLRANAYRDCRVLSIPSDVLFWGHGTALRPEAAELLARVARFLHLVPCRVVVSETPGPGTSIDQALARSVAVMERLVAAGHVPVGQFAVAAPGPANPNDEAVVRIAMLNREVYP